MGALGVWVSFTHTGLTMKKEKVKILYQMPITKICNDGGSVVYENEEAHELAGSEGGG